MPIVKCKALDCFHNDRAYCDVIDECQIDISSKGECVDYNPRLLLEYKTINGWARSE